VDCFWFSSKEQGQTVNKTENFIPSCSIKFMSEKERKKPAGFPWMEAR